eukprot:4941736-Amphidinium_carterae.1
MVATCAALSLHCSIHFEPQYDYQHTANKHKARKDHLHRTVGARDKSTKTGVLSILLCQFYDLINRVTLSFNILLSATSANSTYTAHSSRTSSAHFHMPARPCATLFPREFHRVL